MDCGAFEGLFSPISQTGNPCSLPEGRNRTGSAQAGKQILGETGLTPNAPQAMPPAPDGRCRKGCLYFASYYKMLPTCIVQLIKSFVPKPAPYVPLPRYFSWNYMRTQDWNDTDDVRAYGDY